MAPLSSPQFHQEPPRDTGDIRRERGRQHMSAALIYWLARNQWSHPNLQDLAIWALNEEGALHTSQVSHIRNGKMRMLGVKTLDSLGAINLAVWAYHQDRDLLKQLGILSVPARIEGLVRDAEPLLSPHSGEPLDQGGFMLLYLGYLSLPEVDQSSRMDEAAERFPVWGAAQIARSGRTLMEIRVVADEVFPSDHDARRLVAVLAGLENYDAEAFGENLERICQILERVDGKHRTPQELLDQVLA